MKSQVKLLVVLFFYLGNLMYSQNNPTNSLELSNQVQPSIIVIPLVKKGEDIRNLLEGDEHGAELRIAIGRVKEAFDSRGFTTYDFLGTLKKAEGASAFTSESQGDFKEKVIQMSGADIYVEVDITVTRGQSGTEVHLTMQALETATGRSLTTKDAYSQKYYTNDIAKLAAKCIDLIKEDFLNVLQTKFTDIVNNGRSLYIEFTLDSNSKLTFQSEVGTEGDLLSESIVDWMGKNAYKNYAKKGASTALKMIYDDVRIPLKDQSTGMNYEVESFGRLIRKFLKSINATASIEYPRGQIIITIK